jgi:hypothetical protein
MTNQNTPIYSKALSMQRLADAVNQGYTHWVSGTVPLNKVNLLTKKFSIIYQVNTDRNARARGKRAGLGNAKLVLYWDGCIIQWWLLVTPPNGDQHAAHIIEPLKNAFERTERITLDGYELITVPKKGSSGTKLTWRMTDDKYQDWRESIIDAVRLGHIHAIDRLLCQLYLSPGFAGIRSQVGILAGLYQGEVKRSGKKDLPKPPKKLSYVRRLKNKPFTVNQLLAEQKDRFAQTATVSMVLGEQS